MSITPPTPRQAFEKLAANPGPVVIGAVQGASCFGPAYEFLFILETELRRRKLRDRVPMTFVTSEPYIGHLGLDGVGDTKGLLESEMREKHVKWITNARVKNVEPGKMSVEELADDGSVRKTHELPFSYSMMLPAFRGVGAIRGIEKLTNPRGFVIVDKHQRNPAFPNIFAIGVCVAIAPVGATPVPVGVPKTGFMIELMVTATARTSARCCAAETADRRSRPGTRSVSPISAIPASPSWRSRRSRRATSTGPRRANGFISPRSPSKNTSCARSAAAKASRSTSASCSTSSTSRRSRRSRPAHECKPTDRLWTLRARSTGCPPSGRLAPRAADPATSPSSAAIPSRSTKRVSAATWRTAISRFSSTSGRRGAVPAARWRRCSSAPPGSLNRRFAC